MLERSFTCSIKSRSPRTVLTYSIKYRFPGGRILNLFLLPAYNLLRNPCLTLGQIQQFLDSLALGGVYYSESDHTLHGSLRRRNPVIFHYLEPPSISHVIRLIEQTNPFLNPCCSLFDKFLVSMNVIVAFFIISTSTLLRIW